MELEQVELQPANGVPDFYWNLNPLGKTPTFVGADGLVLTECMAIALHGAFPPRLTMIRLLLC